MLLPPFMAKTLPLVPVLYLPTYMASEKSTLLEKSPLYLHKSLGNKKTNNAVEQRILFPHTTKSLNANFHFQPYCTIFYVSPLLFTLVSFGLMGAYPAIILTFLSLLVIINTNYVTINTNCVYTCNNCVYTEFYFVYRYILHRHTYFYSVYRYIVYRHTYFYSVYTQFNYVCRYISHRHTYFYSVYTQFYYVYTQLVSRMKINMFLHCLFGERLSMP
jgi:hypothetical protein